ncbi:MAG: hypothetical protein JKY52_06465 [Flavobacteriales bacterium]|nr:hypothetical protein [Flavobacteriales bacterium]
MKLKTTLFISAAILLAINSTYSQCDTSLYRDSAGLRQGFWSGPTEEYLHSSGCYVDGYQHGLWEWYNSDSTLRYRVTYQMGLKLSFVIYSSEGRIQERAYSYRTDSGFFRIDTMFYETGEVKRLGECIYVENVDSVKILSSDLYGFWHFDNWVWHGTQMEYFEDGTLKSNVNFKLGVKHGESTTYWFNKEEFGDNYNTIYKSVTHYVNGLDHGASRGYWTSGELARIINSDMGKVISKEWFDRK